MCVLCDVSECCQNCSLLPFVDWQYLSVAKPGVATLKGGATWDEVEEISPPVRIFFGHSDIRHSYPIMSTRLLVESK